MTWFTLSTPLTAHTLARAKNVNAIFTSVATSFAKLMDSDLFRDRRIFLGTDTGVMNAYVVTLAPAPPAYVVGMTIDLLPANTNTGASTINVNGLGAKNILDSSGAAAGAGLIVANRIVTLKYDGTSFRTAPTQTLVTPGDGTVTVAKLAPPLSTMAANLSNSWNPATDDTTDLGQATHRWRNIFLAALAVLNFNNGNYTLTHSAGLLTASGAITAVGTITANLFSGSGASLTSLPAGQLTGTVASARISGVYSGITGVGALDAGSITSGFGSISVTGTITASSTITAGANIVTSGATMNLAPGSAGTISLRPNGVGSASGQMTIATSGLVTVNGSATITGDLTSGTVAATNGTITGLIDFGTSIAAGNDGVRISGGSTTQITSARAGTGATSLTHVAFIRVGGTIGSISTAGPTTTYATSSDETLKRFTGLLDPFKAMEIIRLDPVRSYIWKQYDLPGIGWGAQTSYEISPDLAVPGGWYDEATGKWVDKGTKGAAYWPWSMDRATRIPYLWAFAGHAIDVLDDHHNVMVQHSEMLDDHEARIDAMEEKIASLTAENVAMKAALGTLNIRL